ncbi:hypothetical protein ACHAXT_002776 [Thalassiosira profunda]
MSTASSRLAMEATQRRRQRKQLQQARKSGGGGTNSQRANENNGPKVQIGLDAVPTTSTTTFDDSTITSGASTLTADTFNFAIGMEIGGKSKGAKNETIVKTSESKEAVEVVPSPKSRTSKLKALHKARKKSIANGASATSSPKSKASSKSSLVGISYVDTQSVKAKDAAATPKNGNLSKSFHKFRSRRAKSGPYAKLLTGAPSDECTVNSMDVLLDVTSKHSKDNHSTGSGLSLSAAQEKIRHLTAERDRLRGDVSTYKRKYQTALDGKKGNEELNKQLEDSVRKLKDSHRQTRSATLSAGDAAAKMAALHDQVEVLTKQLEFAKSKARCHEMEAKEREEKASAEHSERLHALEQRLADRVGEVVRLKARNEELSGERSKAEVVLEAREGELRREAERLERERDLIEGERRECKEKLEKLERECSLKYAQHAKEKSELEISLQELQSERHSSLAERREVEKGLRDEISDLKDELAVHQSSVDTMRRSHAKIVESLKSDLASARQLREDSAVSLQRDLNTMREEHENIERFYKDEAESLRSQLRSVKGRADADRKERDTLARQLAKARDDVESIKSVRDKDIQLLESELDTTYRSKVEMEVELKDTKRQLNNALRNLDEMAMDGGRMRTDLEGVMTDFSLEKQHYQKEINALQSDNVEQKCKITDLTRENERLMGDHNTMMQSKESLDKRCHELEEKLTKEVKSAKSLEEKLMKQMTEHSAERRAHQQHDDEECGNKERLMLDLQFLQSKLKKAEEEAAEAKDQLALASWLDHGSDLSDHQAKITQLQSEKVQLSAQVERNSESMEAMRHAQRETTAELSRAKQTIQILKSKEKYLESRVESLANQISRTVRDYESRLSLSRSTSSDGGRSMKLAKSGSGEGNIGSFQLSQSGSQESTGSVTRFLSKHLGERGSGR